jgi:hypothetical protein
VGGNRFDAITQTLTSTQDRRGISRLLAAGALGGLMLGITRDAAVGKNKKKKGKKGKKKNDGCPRGQKKDPYGICGLPPNDCLTVGGLCGLGERCCSEVCRLLGEGEEAHYRCVAGKARCLVDFGCVPGYVCRGFRCQPG